MGAAALVIAAAGAVTFSEDTTTVTSAGPEKLYQASAFTGTSEVRSSRAGEIREQAVSRDSQREALQDAAAKELQNAAEAQARQRNAALAQLAASAERYADEIAANMWKLPLSGYRITATFGQSSGLWASTHTGLDFAAPTGTPVVSVANGTVTSTESSGAYGNRVIVTLEDGTEIWYCHLNTFDTSPGETVSGGEQIGTVGATGNVTGPHLHLEVRPGAGDAVDPYAALVAHGIQP
ncbi:MAG TPA: M23 family metallopeptidase [Nocardioidaceae bacterium]|nr:M23 family metallopeptidase [Nocardioidaceae bacterium]